MGLIMIMSLYLINADFPISTNSLTQHYPCPLYENGQYYVFWSDQRYYSPDYSIYGARVAIDGTVLDPDGKMIFRRQTAFELSAAYDGANFLIVSRDSC